MFNHLHSRFMWDGYDNLDTCWVRTQQSDGAEVGTVPFYSGLINGKGMFLECKKYVCVILVYKSLLLVIKTQIFDVNYRY